MELQCLNSVQRALLTGLLAAAVSLAAGPPSRIRSEIQNRQTFRLNGNVHPLIASAQDQGEVDDSLALSRIAMHFQMTAAQQADLDSLLQAQQDPASPQFHQWLTPEEYADRFGLSTADVGRITNWLERMGFTEVRAARSRTFVTMSGVAAVVRYAFQTPIHHYLVNGIQHYANAAEPALPVELEGMVAGIRGLSDFRPRPHSRPKPRYTSQASGNHFLAPGDFATIYNLTPLYNSGINGSGQSIAVVGQTGQTGQLDRTTIPPSQAWVAASDIEAFETNSGLPVKDPTIISDGFNSSASSGDEEEAALDLEWAGAVARGAAIIYVNSSDAFTSVAYAIDNNVAPILSVTYGLCEDQSKGGLFLSQVNSMNSLFQQANAQGITIVAASGDTGAADCEALQADGSAPTIAVNGLGVDFPASSPYVTGMGGTEFTEGTGTYWNPTNGVNSGSALSYIPEMVWNDTTNLGGEISAGGGGVSVIFAKPSWQQGITPNDSSRDVPDVSLAASNFHDGYLICDAGWCTNGYRNSQLLHDVIGGTSAGAPTFAGIVALINQKTNSRQGNVNPTLYSLATRSPGAFHDITAGDNKVPCQIGTANCTTGSMGYSAGTGYDLATGLGTVNAYNLVTAWSGAAVPPAPVLTSPANGATGVALSPTLTWQASTGATSYNISFGTVFPPPQVAQTAATTYSPGVLSAGVTYYWIVTAVNSVGSASSATWSFTTAVVAPPAPVLASPANGATGVAISPTLTWQVSTGATSYNVSFGTVNPPPQVTQTAATTYSPGALSAGVTYYWRVTAVNSAGSASSAVSSFSTRAGANAGALLFVPVTPCRVADTRGAQGPFGGPTMTGGTSRSFVIPQSGCGIPATAKAYSLNVTVVPQGPLSFLTLWPTGENQPQVSTLNSFQGIVVANAAIVPAGANGAVSVAVTDSTDVILDIDGYFSDAAGGAAFYAATPCRVADTRSANGPLGGPSMTSAQTRDLPVLASPCGLPSSASAYSMNVTVVPSGPLPYLTTWPTGQAQPNVSTLNSFTGKVVANAAIVPSGAGGDISVYVADATQVILDTNGYFAAPGGAGALAFYPVAPCRVADTRNPQSPFGGPSLTANSTRSFTVPASGCSIPSTAQAYSLNVTVVPAGPLSFLTAWPAGQNRPFVSTLNSFDGSIVANAAIVPAGTSGAISVYATDTTDVILDIDGYFAP